ncbi:TfoX/Sxy family protein [Brevibacillus dissolubilis]|uniref:TfoX/Sxy family protein n=1 Tax=Brevibacillus dissolubilis TaxID=1844116 RepID=UPI0011160EC4|nr:TfoX/Sxy family protein [Brevibacillus dissolubilis]
MSMNRPSEESKAFFKSIIPIDPRINLKPMFGNLASFINGNMFAGLYGDQVFVRLPEAERQRLIEEEGATQFAPMQGRPMKEYVTVPEKWRQDPERVSSLVQQSLAWAETLPMKEPSKKKKPKV